MSRYAYTAALFLSLSLSLTGCNKPGADGVTPVAAQTPAQGGAGGGGNQGQGRGGGRRGGGGGPVPVLTAKVEAKSVPVTIPAVGTAEPLTTVQVRAQVTGQLSEVAFTEGQDVKKGQLLFVIDQRPFQAALAQAEAVLARDTATANNASRQRTNYEDLYKRQLISRDQYETQIASAQALDATLAADRATVDNAKLNLAYTRIAAPISGRTGTLGVHQGDLVRANDATAMVVINQVSPIYVTFSVPGRYLGDIRRYQAQKPLVVVAQGQASLPPGAQAPPPQVLQPSTAQQVAPGQGATMPVKPGLLEQGHVSFIDNSVDAQTGTIKMKGTFQNADQGLWPGLFVQVTLNLTSDENAIVVPAAAVQPSASGQYVYVVKPDRTAEVRPVTVLRQQGEEVVIAKGLSAGEEVVTEGQLRLTPGAQVTDAARGLSTGSGRGGGGGGGQGGGRRRGDGGNGNGGTGTGGNGQGRGRGNSQ